MTNELIQKELAEIEEMIAEAKKHEDYTEKVFILREGMIQLAGGFAQAALLSSLLGWTRHWLKTDNEIYKQIQKAAENNDLNKVRKLKEQIRQGWFWKAYREMSEELLKQVSPKTCERYVQQFEKMGLISSRDAEEKATYRAKWYKANIDKIKEELNKLGFELDYYKEVKNSTRQNDESQNTGFYDSEKRKTASLRTRQNDEPPRQNDEPPRQNDEHLLYSSSIDDLLDSSSEEEEKPTVDPVEIFKKAWQKVFSGCPIKDSQVNEFIGLAMTKGLTMDEIQKEMEHIQSFYKDDEEADYAALLYRSMEAGGWVKTGRAFMKAKKNSAKKSTRKSSSVKPKKNADLPKSVQKQIEAEKQGSNGTHTTDDDELKKKQARIQAKLKLMNERLAKRKKDLEEQEIAN